MITSRVDGIAEATRMLREHEEKVRRDTRDEVAKEYDVRLADLAKTYQASLDELNRKYDELATRTEPQAEVLKGRAEFFKQLEIEAGEEPSVGAEAPTRKRSPNKKRTANPSLLTGCGLQLYNAQQVAQIMGTSPKYVKKRFRGLEVKLPGVDRFLIREIDVARRVTEPLWSVKQVAEMLGVGETTIYRAIRSGRLRSTEVESTPGFGPPTVTKISPADLVTFVNL
jgi:AraC-like DNA-binding protein